MKKWIHAAQLSDRAQQAAQKKYQAELDMQYVKDCAKAIQQIVKKSRPELADKDIKMNSSLFKYGKNTFVTIVETNYMLSEEDEVRYEEFLDQLDDKIQDLVESEYPDIEIKWGRYPGRYSRGYDWGYLVTYKDPDKR